MRGMEAAKNSPGHVSGWPTSELLKKRDEITRIIDAIHPSEPRPTLLIHQRKLVLAEIDRRQYSEDYQC